MAESVAAPVKRPGTPRPYRLAAGFGALSTVLCLLFSWHVSYWKDEVDSLSASTRGVPGLWRLVHHIDAVHAVYYLVLDGWTSLAGRSEFAVRLPSAVVTGVATAGVFVLANAIASRRVAVWSTVVFLVLPRVTWMGIEARSFAVTGAIGVWLTYLFVRAVRAERNHLRSWWLGYAVLGALGVATNIYVALLVVAHGIGLALAAAGRRELRPWMAAAVGAAVLSSPVVVAGLGQRGQLGDSALGLGQLLRSIVVNQWFLGNTPTPSGQAGGTLAVHGAGDLWRVAAPLLALVCWVLVLTGLWRARRQLAVDPTAPPRLLVPAVLVPTVLIAGYSLAISPMYSARYFCFVAFAVAILIGAGIDALAGDARRIVALGVVVVLAAPIYASQRTVFGKGSDWSAAADYVAAHARRGDGVYFTPRFPPAVGDTSVGSTSRYIAVGYPDAFAGLRDVTLLRTAVQDDSLVGVSRLLTDAGAQLRDLDVVWVVRRNDYPAIAADDRVLRQAGLHSARRWRGTVDTVVEFVR